MTPRIVKAEYAGAYKLRLELADGTSGEIDLEPELWGEVFEPLRDLRQFKAFRFDDALSTIVWPTGADFAPELLYEACVGRAAAGARSQSADHSAGAE